MTPTIEEMTPEKLGAIAVCLRVHPRHYGETLLVKSNADVADKIDAAADAWLRAAQARADDARDERR